MDSNASHKITYLKLPLQFEEKKLVEDLQSILEKPWTPHFNTDGYEGHWSSIALYSENGEETNIHAMHDEQAVLKETAIMRDCLYLKEVVHAFNCPLLSVRLLNLGVGAFIKPHRDHALGYEDGCFRLHIPISTNDQVQFMLDGQSLNMKPGECWYTNVNYEHSVANQGKTDRVHLVIDGQRNDWSDDLFFSLAPKESFFPKMEEKNTPETIKQIIEQLKQLDEPAAKELIKQFQKKLAQHL